MPSDLQCAALQATLRKGTPRSQRPLPLKRNKPNWSKWLKRLINLTSIPQAAICAFASRMVYSPK